MKNKLKYFYLIPRYLRSSFYLQFNKFLFTINEINFGENLKVYNKLHFLIRSGALVRIGNNFLITSGDGFNPLCRNNRAKLFIGNNVGMSSPVLYVSTEISIGNNVKIGA